MGVKMLVCTDGSKTANTAVRFAGLVGNALKSETTLLHVEKCRFCGIPPLRESLLRKREASSDAILGEGQKILRNLGVEAKTKKRVGVIEAEIIAEANEGDYDLVAIGSEGVKGIEMLFFGALSYKLIENINKPIIVVKKGRMSVSRILICNGGSAQAMKATSFGGRIAKAAGAKTTLLHVIENGSLHNTEPVRKGEEVLKAGAKILGDSGVYAETSLVKGRRSNRILETARRGNYDLIVLGEKSADPAKLLLSGSVVYEVLKNAKTPCLIVK